jgi:hypothetical protein
MSNSVKPWDFLNPETEYVDAYESTRRYNICESCDRFFRLTRTCKECGCFMNIKTNLKNATCPIGKW